MADDTPKMRTATLAEQDNMRAWLFIALLEMAPDQHISVPVPLINKILSVHGKRKIIIEPTDTTIELYLIDTEDEKHVS